MSLTNQQFDTLYQIIYALPELFIASLIFIIAIIIAVARRKTSIKLVAKVAIVGCILTFILMLVYNSTNIQYHTYLFSYDHYSYHVKIFLMIFVLSGFLLFSVKRLHRNLTPTFYILAYGLVLSLMITISANSSLSMFLGLELYTLSVCFLITLDNDRDGCVKASARYLIASAIMSTIFLYGASLCYSNFGSISNFCFNAETLDISGRIGILFIISYLLFKMNAAPFHIWSINVYETSSIFLVMVLDTLSKIIIFVVLAHYCVLLLTKNIMFFQTFLMIVSIISMIVGGAAPFTQNNIKKFIAYSSVGHIGFAILVLALFREVGEIRGAITYMFSYCISSLCFFFGVIGIKYYKNIESISELKGVIRDFPIYAYAILCGILSMVGLPPFFSFLAKIEIFNTIVETGRYDMLCVAFFYTLSTIAYTIKIIRYIFTKDNSDVRIIIENKTNVISLFVICVLIIATIFGSAVFERISRFSIHVITASNYSIDNVQKDPVSNPVVEHKKLDEGFSVDDIKELYDSFKKDVQPQSSLVDRIYGYIKG